MISYKEFYIWLEGYLTGKLENKNINISPIVEKMQEVKEVDSFFSNPSTIVPHRFEPVPIPPNPFKDDGYNDLGTPPKIVM